MVPDFLCSDSLVASFLEDGPTWPDAIAAGGSALPSLFSNNSTEQLLDNWNLLTGGHKRSAFVLSFEIMALAKEFGIDRLGFLTLTFADLVLDLKEANRRFNSLNTHVLKGRYLRGVVVPERQKSGRVHYHLLVVLRADIRSGCDFAAFERKDYRSANPALRSEWAFWRKTAPLYGFGRHELLPVKSNAEGIARYVGKYISKHVGERVEGDKGARLVRYLGYPRGTRKATCRFGWVNENAWLWRHKLAAFAERNGCRDTDDLGKLFGPRWAYRCQVAIMAERLDVVHPSRACAERSSELTSGVEVVKAQVRDLRDRLEQGKTFARTVNLDQRKFQAGPVWNVPTWSSGFVHPQPPSAVAVAGGESRARDLRLYAMRLEPLKK